MLQPAHEGLQPVVGHAGPVSGVRGNGGIDARTQPNYSAQELADVEVPVAIVHSEKDEFIKREHAEYLAKTIAHAELIVLDEVSHFAPPQRPKQFNAVMLRFFSRVTMADHSR